MHGVIVEAKAWITMLGQICQDCGIGVDAPMTEIMKSNQNGRSTEIRTRLEQISCRPERQGIDQQ